MGAEKSLYNQLFFLCFSVIRCEQALEIAFRNKKKQQQKTSKLALNTSSKEGLYQHQVQFVCLSFFVVLKKLLCGRLNSSAHI